METLLVQALRRHGLPDPVTQFEVRDEFGNVVAQADAAYPQWRVTIEYDSRQEHSDEFQLARDARRRNEVIAAGYLVLSARHDDLRTGGAALADQILRAARRHAS
jgi:very-short-patch-repair endonuclease